MYSLGFLGTDHLGGHTLFILSKDKVYKDIEAEILPKIKDILRTKPSLRFKKKNLYSKFRLSLHNFLKEITMFKGNNNIYFY